MGYCKTTFIKIKSNKSSSAFDNKAFSPVNVATVTPANINKTIIVITNAFFPY